MSIVRYRRERGRGRGVEEVRWRGGDADPAKSDDFETARISSRYDEYRSTASLRAREIGGHTERNLAHTSVLISQLDGCFYP